MDTNTFPTPEVGFALHQRLLAGDRPACKDAYLLYSRPLTSSLLRRHPHDEHLVVSAVNDAILDYLRHPQAFDPARLDLGRYLRMAAHRDYLNLVRKELRHSTRNRSLPDVELVDPRGKSVVEQLSAREETLAARDAIEGLRAQLSDRDRCVLDLLLASERSTSAYVAVLNLSGLAPDEQERTVKQAKDRVKKRLVRGGFFHDRSGPDDGRAGAA